MDKLPSENSKKLPQPDADLGLTVLKEMIVARSPLAALETMRDGMGHVFEARVTDKFCPALVSGPKLNRQLLVTDREKFHWRTESDPVTKLLRSGILVQDGEEHQCVHAAMAGPMSRKAVLPHIAQMSAETDRIIDQWQDGESYDMLVEMRKVALVVLCGTLFKIDFLPDMDRMWDVILKVIGYISPGAWLLWPTVPRPQYERALAEMDAWLYTMIRERRANVGETDDLLGHLVANPEMTDGMIRDQLLTMLIAGHDTSTALFAWALLLLGENPSDQVKVHAELATVLGDSVPEEKHLGELNYLDWVIKETLRLYPPIHMGNRKVAEDVELDGYVVEAGRRVMYSIYLSHRDPAYWADAEEFRPKRHNPRDKEKVPPFTYLPFGGGPRLCIGVTYAQVEAKVVLARILQKFDLMLLTQNARTHMGATLEPRPGVVMRVRRK